MPTHDRDLVRLASVADTPRPTRLPNADLFVLSFVCPRFSTASILELAFVLRAGRAASPTTSLQLHRKASMDTRHGATRFVYHRRYPPVFSRGDSLLIGPNGEIEAAAPAQDNPHVTGLMPEDFPSGDDPGPPRVEAGGTTVTIPASATSGVAQVRAETFCRWCCCAERVGRRRAV